MLRFQMQAMPCLFFKKLNGFSLFWRSNTYPFYSCIGRSYFLDNEDIKWLFC